MGRLFWTNQDFSLKITKQNKRTLQLGMSFLMTLTCLMNKANCPVGYLTSGFTSLFPHSLIKFAFLSHIYPVSSVLDQERFMEGR